MIFRFFSQRCFLLFGSFRRDQTPAPPHLSRASENTVQNLDSEIQVLHEFLSPPFHLHPYTSPTIAHAALTSQPAATGVSLPPFSFYFTMDPEFLLFLVNVGEGHHGMYNLSLLRVFFPALTIWWKCWKRTNFVLVVCKNYQQ